MGLPHVELAFGDRAPNFALADTEGQFRMFYSSVSGRPVLMTFWPGGTAGTAGGEVADLARMHAAYESAGVDILSVSLAPVADNATLGYPFPVWSDGEKAITTGYARAAGLSFNPAAPADAAFAVAMDGNQRVLDVLTGAGIADRALALFKAQPPAEPERILGSMAPVLVMPNLIDPETCTMLIDRWKADHHEGTVGAVVGEDEKEYVNERMKKRLDHKIMDPELNRQLQMTVGRRIAAELDKAFYFKGFKFDRFLVVCYDAARGDYFRAHRDNEVPSLKDRRFALTLNLNTEEYEGGELIFPEYGPHKYRPSSGGAVVFSCSLLHEALPVTKGRRFALLTFLRALPEAPAEAPARPKPAFARPSVGRPTVKLPGLS